jgi:hypothetical protein
MTTLTIKTPLPGQSFQVGTVHAQSDANGLITDVAAGSELAKMLISYGCTVVTPMIPPSTDPQIVGALWNNNGTLAISAG